jgi:hypothetical protein
MKPLVLSLSAGEIEKIAEEGLDRGLLMLYII